MVDVDTWPSKVRGVHVVGLNPALDRTEEVPNLRLHEVNRAVRVSPRVGGKGFIVARALRRLDVDVSIHGFLGGPVGLQFREAGRRLGIVDLHTDIEEETRINTIIVDPDDGRATVINEPGPSVSAEEFAQLTAELTSTVHEGDLVAFSGSVPQGVSPAAYAELIADCERRGALAVVDASNDVLRAAAEVGPWAIKCNLAEFAELVLTVSPEWTSEDQLPALSEAMRGVIRDSGVRIVFVTLGAEGMVVTTAAEAFRVFTAPIDVRNPTGSGDHLLAGLLAGAARGFSLRDSLKLASAVAAANAAMLVPDIGEDPDLDGFLHEVRVMQLADLSGEASGV